MRNAGRNLAAETVESGHNISGPESARTDRGRRSLTLGASDRMNDYAPATAYQASCPACGCTAVYADVRPSTESIGVLIGSYCCARDHGWITRWAVAA
jgi:hypothetical protein